MANEESTKKALSPDELVNTSKGTDSIELNEKELDSVSGGIGDGVHFKYDIKGQTEG